MAKKIEFPQKLYVIKETPPNDTPYFVAMEGGIESVDTEQDVAIYELVQVGRVQITKCIA